MMLLLKQFILTVFVVRAGAQDTSALITGDRVEPDVRIETINTSNESKSASTSAVPTDPKYKTGSAITNINCPGACISETFAAYCRVSIADGLCGHGGLCCANENDGQTVTAGQDGKSSKQPIEIEKKAGRPIECTGSCVSSLFSLLCDKVDYTATCNSGGVCCLNTGATSTPTTTSSPPPASLTLPTCVGRCLPGFMHTACRSKGNQVSTETTMCPPATICCLDTPGRAGGGDVYTNDRGPDGPGIILTGPPNVQSPFPLSGSSRFAVPTTLNKQPSVSGELFGLPLPIQEEAIGPLSSAELVTKIASTIQCPGSCIAPLMKFTCFGSNDVFPHFKCTDGYMCCADTSDVKRTLSAAIILNQVGPLGPHSVPPGGLIPVPTDGSLFAQRPSPGELPPHGDNKLNPSSEPQESQLQPINVRPPTNIVQQSGALSERLPNGPKTPPVAIAPATSPQPHSPPLSSGSPPLSPPASQGNFVPALRPRPGQSPVALPQESTDMLLPSPTSLSASQPLVPSITPVSGTRLKSPSYHVNTPNQSSFLGSKNFNRVFRPIGQSEPVITNTGAKPTPSSPASSPVLTAGGFVPTRAASPSIISVPSLTDSPPILPAPHSQASRESNGTRLKGFSREPLSCGRRSGARQQKVIGGKDAGLGDWCWQAAIYNEKGQYVCGGALIGPQWIVTAAHCVTKYVRNGDTFFVEVGSVDLTARHGHSRKKAWASYIHHNYNENTLDNDIALVKVLNPFNVNSSSISAACTVCLPGKQGSKNPEQAAQGQEGQSTRCTVTGYGALQEGGPVAMRVRQVELPMVEERTCVAQLSAATAKLFKLPASTFCAGGEKGNDACQGDGGSPMVCDMGGFYELKGLVSWGLGCGRQDVPGVYVKVSSFIGWINQIISVNTA
ncbi:uncharacterized protein LOC111263045 isoform X2 [Varroa jacobsoni]|uniref:uncharacterized protein LOC111263045 isoform X2 n=1 Tax=Varroa jacobsoni TaxID=62625 RepID=UPI000BF5CB89|nr:uncharacterized protein LOC111263045 isoform X2 [Varroa jacobsoni]